jgi:EmrB/QacA subfamily drug resistance transporter
MKARIFAEENRKWWTLAAVSFGLFMIMLDNTIVNVALPSIQRSLDLKISELEWVVTGYALTFGALMLTGGKLADLLGRRLIFVVGLAIFTLSSLACGLAGSASLLIAARVVQGVGAAMMNPSTLSIITVTFPPRQRGTAIGIWAGVSALALAIGPLVGGLITEHINWNWIFFINVPVGAIAIVAAYAFIDESRDTSQEQRPDFPGLISSALGLFALSYALIEANTYGWTSGRILAAFVIAAVALVGFVLFERHQRLPMLDLSLFRNVGFTGANSVMLLVGLAMFGVFFYVSLYVQQVLGYSPIEAGASFLPWTLLIILIAPQAGRLSDRIGPRPLVTSGMAVLAGSLFVFSRLGVHASFWGLRLRPPR